MNLSKLTKMAALAVDATESGDDTAAPELHAFVLEHIVDVAEALGLDEKAARDAMTRCTVEGFAHQFLKSCRTPRIKEAARNAKRARDTEKADAASRVFADSIMADGIAYKFDGAALLALAKALPPTKDIVIVPGGGKSGIAVPARVVRELDKVHALARCAVHMTSPVLGDWRFIIEWRTGRGAYVQRRVETQFRDVFVVALPSMTQLVERDCEAA